MKRITLCSPDGDASYVLTAHDAAQIPTAVGTTMASDLIGSTKSSAVLIGATGDGDVTYTSRRGGSWTSGIRVRHITGPTGVGNENRPLAVSVAGLDATVTFGTDGAGATVVPTAAAIVAAVTASPAVSNRVTAVAGGTGLGSVAAHPFTNLVGGQDNGSVLKFYGKPNICARVSSVETV